MLRTRLMRSAQSHAETKKPHTEEDVRLNLKVGAPVGSRTPNLLIRSQMLYPIELRVHERGREEAMIRE